jgi:hypothetical protein
MTMAQSDIQSLVQNLTGVHTTGQAFVPSSVNNGNPATTYNAPQSPFVPPAPVTQYQPAGSGYVPPETNAWGSWLLPAKQTPTSVPTSTGPDWAALAAKAPPGGLPSGFAGFDAIKNTGAGWTPGSTTGGTQWPTVPPSGTGGGPGGPQTGGPNPPVPGTGVGTGGGNHPGTFFGGKYDPNSGAIRSGSGGGWGLLDLPPGDISTNFSNNSGNGNIKVSDFLGGLNGLGSLNIDLGSFGQSLAGTSLGKALGVSQNGSFNLAQALDWVLPGNLYMSQTGQTNFANLIPAIFGSINPLLGFGVSKLMDYFGAKYENTDDSKLNWLQKILKNRYVKNKNNRNAAHGGGGMGGYGGGTGGTSGLDSGGGYMGGSSGGVHGSLYGNPFNPDATFLNDSGFGNMDLWGNPMSMFDFHPSDTK